MPRDSFFSGPSGRIAELEAKRKHALLRAEIADLEIRTRLEDATPRHDRPNILANEPPPGIYSPVSTSDLLHPIMPGRVSKFIIEDLNLLCGEPTEVKALQSDYTIKWLEQRGYTSDEVLALPQTKQHKLAKQILAEIKRIDAMKRDQTDQLAAEVAQAHDLWKQDIEETGRRLALPFKLERPQGSSLHHLAEYLKSCEPVDGVSRDGLVEEIEQGRWQSFVIEHDWAAAFAGASDFDQGGFQLPYDFTCFEFRVNGMRVIMLCGQGDGDDIHGNLVVGVNGRWYLNADQFELRNGKIISVKLNENIEAWAGKAEAFLNKLAEQIRAICIMLDAQVAERELVRASERLNEIRAKKGKTPLRSYHVVSLARKHRARPMEDHVVTPGAKRRLHFRRGHWRHFTDHKTWINWMLVGDPDLGFVDKHYKL